MDGNRIVRKEHVQDAMRTQKGKESELELRKMK